MADPDELQMITARLSPRAAAGMRAFCAMHGVTIAGLLEATAKRLSAVDNNLPPFLVDVVEDARLIDSERRGRRNRR